MTINHPAEIYAMTKALISPINNVTQGHTGNWYYYIQKIGQYYGELIYIPILYMIYTVIKKRSWQTTYIFLWIFIPLILFSIAETKRFTYILIFAPAIFMYSGHFISSVVLKSSITKWMKITAITALFALPIRFSIERIDFLRDNTPTVTAHEIWHTNLYNFTNNQDQNRLIIFNTPKHIETMFYTNCVAYPFKANNTLLSLKTKGYLCYELKDGKYIELH